MTCYTRTDVNLAIGGITCAEQQRRPPSRWCKRHKPTTQLNRTLDTQRGFAMAKSATLQAENRERARRKLVGYRAQCDILEKLLRIIEAAESRLTSITAQYEETRSSGEARDRMADQIIMLNDQVDRLSGVISEQSEALDEVLWLINSLLPEHPTIARIMSKRYLEPNYEPTFREIAEEMGYDEGYVRHKHLEGLDLVSEILKESTKKHTGSW